MGRRMVQKRRTKQQGGKSTTASYLSAVLVAGMASKEEKEKDGKLKGWRTLQKRQEWRVWGVERRKEEKKEW